MTRSNDTITGAIFILYMTIIASADTLYLKDGSILTGLIIEDTAQACVIDNALLGALSIPKSHILLEEMDTPVDRVETFTITRDATTVVSRVSCSVPTLDPNATSFKRLITGDLQAICDSNGLEIPFTSQLIGNNSLVSIQTLDLAPDTRTLIATTLQDELIRTTSAGHLSFCARFTPNANQTIRVVLKYPKNLTLQTISPEPQFQQNGLIVWEQPLQRQQTFSPTITFMR